MELQKTIEDRRSIRKYKEKEVNNELLTQLLESARLCQSAKNRQPWRFKILNNDDKNIIADLTENSDNLKSEINEFNNSVVASSKIMRQCPVVILVFRVHDDNLWIDSDHLSIGACIENMCLKATELGLGSLWVRDIIYAEKEIKEYLNIEGYDLVSALYIGYSDEYPEKRPRKMLDELLL